MNTKHLILSSLLLLGIYACEKDGSDNIEPQIPESCNIVQVSSSIKEPTLWKAGNVYVITRDLQVESILTIEPGVTIKLKDASIQIVGGKIIAKGTAQHRIVFTSLADDRYCGDTDGNGLAAMPAKGDWEEITLSNTTETIFQYVDIFYAGKSTGGNSNAIEIGGSRAVSFTFDNCRIAHTLYQNTSYDRSAAFYGGSYMADPMVSKFTNNIFFDNGKPLQLNAYYTLNPNNKFHNPELPSQKNSHNGIYMYAEGSGKQNATVTWGHTEVPYVLAANFHQVHTSSTINIPPNVIVKFKTPSDGIHSVRGNVKLSSSAKMTSYKDDIYGGDTNGDGNATTPAQGDWLGFQNTIDASQREWKAGPNILYAKN